MSGDLDFSDPKNYGPAIIYKLGIIEGKVDALVRSVVDVKADHLRLEATVDDQRRDIDRVKGRQLWLTGTGTGAGAIVGLLASKIGVILGLH